MLVGDVESAANGLGMAGGVELYGTDSDRRKTIERAKGILMRSRRLSEKDAYTLLRQTAMIQNKRIYDVADAIISMAAAIGSGRASCTAS
jgi:AmiR/NasT family two-component response regulator